MKSITLSLHFYPIFTIFIDQTNVTDVKLIQVFILRENQTNPWLLI